MDGEWTPNSPHSGLIFTCSAYYQPIPLMRPIARRQQFVAIEFSFLEDRSSVSPLLEFPRLPKALRENAELSYASNFTIDFLT
jgi:hypothetical protein